MLLAAFKHGPLQEVRSVCEEFSKEGLVNFPSGIAFTFWEQYLHLSSNLLQAICVITLAVFCVISIILFNPWAAGNALKFSFQVESFSIHKCFVFWKFLAFFRLSEIFLCSMTMIV